ncbi:hypothetical protein [Halalkalicoccus salilacus]|uniref:hypothetical protein n=1 Tax=Halalkalicoccus sp. GCM10025704 TaxID=3252662 RepID=UPI00361D8A74
MTWWGSLERRSATAFLVAGALLVVFAVLLGVEAFMGRSAPEDLFGPAGFLVAMVGLLGLYPTLVDQTPKLARVAAGFAAVAAVGWFVITGLSITEVAGILPPLEDADVVGITAVLVAGLPWSSRMSRLAWPVFVSKVIREPSASSCWRRPSSSE